MFSDGEEAALSDSGEEQESDNELGGEEEGDMHQAAPPYEPTDAGIAAVEKAVEETPMPEESASKSTKKDTSKWLALSGEQLRSLSGFVHRNRNVVIAGIVITGILIAAWKYRSSADEASKTGE